MAINGTNAQALAQQLSAFTSRAALFDDKMDVIFVTHIMERLLRFVDRIQDVRFIRVHYSVQDLRVY